MLKRFLTGVVIMALVVGFFALRFVSPYFMDAFFGVVLILSTYEICTICKNTGKKLNTNFVLAFSAMIGVLATLLSILKVDIILTFGVLLASLILMFAVTFVLNFVLKDRTNKEMVESKYVGTLKKYAIEKSMTNLFVMAYPDLILSLFFVINHFSDFSNYAGLSGKNVEFFALIIIFVTTIITDTGAYFIGSGLQGKKLCPKISPNKTISGAIGGLVLSAVLSMVMFFILSPAGFLDLFATYNLTYVHFIVYGIIASIFTQCGDIFASYIKRRLGVKDFGKILPGHGGIMDRVDGLMFNGFVTLILIMIIFA